MSNPPSSVPAISSFIQEAGAQERRGFDFRHFWHAILEKLWVVALCTLAGLFLSLGYLARTPKLYQSHAVLEVDFQEPTSFRATITAPACARCFSPARKLCARSSRT
jgi:uncharacterized protein involved in exopolysaccharide biosynthesis